MAKIMMNSVPAELTEALHKMCSASYITIYQLSELPCISGHNSECGHKDSEGH